MMEIGYIQNKDIGYSIDEKIAELGYANRDAVIDIFDVRERNEDSHGYRYYNREQKTV